MRRLSGQAGEVLVPHLFLLKPSKVVAKLLLWGLIAQVVARMLLRGLIAQVVAKLLWRGLIALNVPEA